MHLYLSFARIDEPYALQFADLLKHEHTINYDDRLFIRNWWQRTLIQLDSCDALLYFISPEGAAAEYCRRECEVMQQAGRAVIPILIVDGAPVLTMLEGYTMLDFRAGITIEGELALRAVLAAVEVDKTQTVYGVEAAQRPLEVSKDEPGALITEANQEAFEEKWERVVYLLRSALATGFTSELVNVRGLLSDAEVALMEARYEREAGRAYAALKRTPYRLSNLEAFRADARTFAQSYPGYDPDGVLRQAGIQVASPIGIITRTRTDLDVLDDVSPAQRWSTSGFDLGLVFDYVKSILNPRGDSGRLVIVVLVIAVFVIALANPSRQTAPRNQGPYPYATSVRNVSTPTPIAPPNVPMSLVEGGCFEMDDARVCVSSYWLDRYEVSNRQFASYRGRAASNPPSRLELHPRTQITYLEARRFCESRDARLPTESEWEFAIGGGRNMDYPWGDEFIEGHANVAGDGDGYYLTSPVFAYAEYQSPERVVNLIGNVAEWVDAEDDLFTSQVVRGGSYRTTVNAEGQFNDRYTRSERFRSDDVGFRCARDAETAQIATSSDAATDLTAQPDSTTMQFVSGGCFRMGNNGQSPSETPVHQVCVDDFWMDRHEVSYGEFQNHGGVAREENAVRGLDFPRTNVTWAEARAFCIERGARLPTEAEWEYAASNQGRNIYPWGDVFRSFNANVANQPQRYEGAAPVNAYADYATSVGIVNLSGNVAEWVNSVFAPYPYDSTDGRESFEGERRVIRGGSYLTSAFQSRAASRNSNLVTYAGDDLGFRCARDA
jgi:formylglycine-generating enzyme required for sulfatase activity